MELAENRCVKYDTSQDANNANVDNMPRYAHIAISQHDNNNQKMHEVQRCSKQQKDR